MRSIDSIETFGDVTMIARDPSDALSGHGSVYFSSRFSVSQFDVLTFFLLGNNLRAIF
jgi:hypothetical protein